MFSKLDLNQYHANPLKFVCSVENLNTLSWLLLSLSKLCKGFNVPLLNLIMFIEWSNIEPPLNSLDMANKVIFSFTSKESENFGFSSNHPEYIDQILSVYNLCWLFYLFRIHWWFASTWNKTNLNVKEINMSTGWGFLVCHLIIC